MGEVIQFPAHRIRMPARPLATPLTAIAASSNDYDFVLDVDGFAWVASKLGCDAAAAYLTLSRGCTHNQRSTLWSVSAVERRTGMDNAAARDAVAALFVSGLLTRTNFGQRPAYRINAVSSHPDMRTYVHDYTISGGVFCQAIEAARRAGDRHLMHRLVLENGQSINRRQHG